MLEWTQEHQALLWWLAVASVVTFVGTLVAIPIGEAQIKAPSTPTSQ